MSNKKSFQEEMQDKYGYAASCIQNSCGLPAEVAVRLLSGSLEEPQVVQLIKKYLRTDEQRKMLNDLDLSIEDCLNGRYLISLSPQISRMYDEWNIKLGSIQFGGFHA